MVIAVSISSILALMLAGLLVIRFRKRWIAAFNRAIANRIISRFADRLPGFGMVTHIGRKSGRLYRTPVKVFTVPGGFLIALTYGRDCQWVRNVISAGGCQLVARGMLYRFSAPTIVHDPTRRRFTFLLRLILWMADANDYMQLDF
ncbi:MAG: nitroreductase family deazaflavin-dependent oxidoreductase [Candidatus Sulfotelmatobacter sp.]